MTIKGYSKQSEIQKFKALTQEQAAYIAGFFDGEGSVSCTLTKQTAKSGKVYPKWLVQVCSSQVDPRPLIWIQELIGGTLHLSQPKGPISRKPIWDWRLSNLRFDFYFPQLLPYLKVKKEKVEFALQMRALIVANKRTISSLSHDDKSARLKIATDFRTFSNSQKAA
jgi:hypothetical protein